MHPSAAIVVLTGFLIDFSAFPSARLLHPILPDLSSELQKRLLYNVDNFGIIKQVFY